MIWVTSVCDVHEVFNYSPGFFWFLLPLPPHPTPYPCMLIDDSSACLPEDGTASILHPRTPVHFTYPHTFVLMTQFTHSIDPLCSKVLFKQGFDIYLKGLVSVYTILVMKTMQKTERCTVFSLFLVPFSLINQTSIMCTWLICLGNLFVFITWQFE